MQQTIDYINAKTNNLKPEIGIILGSGLGDFVNNFETIPIPYSQIPGFEPSTVQGHAGQLVFVDAKMQRRKDAKQELANSKQQIANNNLSAIQPRHSTKDNSLLLTSNCSLLIMQGRYHFYEGHSMQTVVFPIKVMKKLGVKTLIITNAAGAVNKKFKPADLMIITDHINFMGTNPLIGENDEALGTRFPDMSEVYNKNLISLAQQSAKEIGIKIQKGIYTACSGPSYETPAEVNMLKQLGTDAVGMSTVPEAIVANYCGINVLGISCITNYAAGIQKDKLSHQEVIESANLAKEKFQSLLLKILEKV